VLDMARTAPTADQRPVLVWHQILRGDGATYRYRTGGLA